MSEPIRILHVVGTMNRGGTETLLMELYRHIDRTMIQFDFFVYNYSDKPGDYDAEILELGGKIFIAKKRFYKNPFAFYKELKFFLNEHKEYQIIHSHQFTTSGYILSAAKSSGKLITIAHSHAAKGRQDIVRKIADFIGCILIQKNADFVFGCSESAVKILNGSYSDGVHSFVLKNAVDADKFDFCSTKRENFRKEIGANDKTLVLGYVARFLPIKNHEFLIRVFAEIIKKKENSILVLAGDGSLRPQTEELAKELGVYEKVRFLGVRPDVQDIVNAFDVFVMPSKFEGLGIVLIEAQANGLPCVISADVIPTEADTGAGLVTRVPLDASPTVWADACLNAGERKSSEEVRPSIVSSGYDINAVSAWLQDYYIKHWK